MKITIKGYGAPTLSTAGDAGQRYIDLDTGKEYICTGFQTDTIYEEDNIEPHSYISTNFHKSTVSGYEWVSVGGDVIELEIEFVPAAGEMGEHYRIANIEQAQKVIDNNMNLHIVTMLEGSGDPAIYDNTYSCLKDTLSHGNKYGFASVYRYADYAGNTNYKLICFFIDETEFTHNESIKITDSWISLNSSETVVKAYASFV